MFIRDPKEKVYAALCKATKAMTLDGIAKQIGQKSTRYIRSRLDDLAKEGKAKKVQDNPPLWTCLGKGKTLDYRTTVCIGVAVSYCRMSKLRCLSCYDSSSRTGEVRDETGGNESATIAKECPQLSAIFGTGRKEGRDTANTTTWKPDQSSHI